MEDQEPLVFEDSVHNRLFGFPEVLDKNVDNIIVNECDAIPTKPPDRYNFVVIIFYVLGTCLLLPWYFFITANSYWMYKLRNLENGTQILLFLDVNDHVSRSRLQANFTSFLTIAASIPSTLTLLLNTYLAKKLSIHFRMISSLMLMLILFTITTILVNINSDSWQSLFYLITLGTVIFMNIGSSIMQGAVFNLVSFFDSNYMTATISGQALGGIFASLSQILALWWGASPDGSAFVYFLFANVFILISLVLYAILVKTDVYKYYVEDIPASMLIRRSSSTQYALLNSGQTMVNSYLILKKIWKLGLSTCYNFLVTMSVYPAVTVLISSVNKEHTAWTDTYFVPVIVYLLFNTSDFWGRVISNFIKVPINSVLPSAILSCSRTVFIPMLMLCNANPRHYLPVLINNDTFYAFIIFVFGFTNGVVNNITMISIPHFVDKHEEEVASSLMITFLGVGLCTGSLISFGMVNLL